MKSTLSGTLVLNALEQGYKACMYSGELAAQNVLEWTMLQATEREYIGTKVDSRSGKTFATVDDNIQKRIREWISDKIYLYDNAATLEEKSEADGVLKVFNAVAKRYGCKLFVADNLMSMLCSAEEENKAQAQFTAKLKAFAVKYKAAVILVA